MRLSTLLLVAGSTLILTVPAFAVAGEPAIIPLDLTAAGGPGLWLVCQGESIQNCGIATVWLQSNGLKGLQRSAFSHGGRPWDPDTKLTP